MFFYFCKVLFSDFLKFNGNFVDAQKNSEYRDWAPLNKTLGLDTQQPVSIFKTLHTWQSKIIQSSHS